MENLNDKIQVICDEVIAEIELPPRGIFLHLNVSGRGEKKGRETSKSLCINEPEYPRDVSKKMVLNKSAIIMNIPAAETEDVELVIRNGQFEAISLPPTAVLKDVKDEQFTHVVFRCDSRDLFEYIKKHIIYSVKHYKASSNFGCCSKYMKCSLVGKCVHENKLYAKGCAYGKNLKAGKNFYGNQ